MGYFLILILTITACGATPDWNGLRVTWSMNPFNKWGFNSVPRDLHGDLGGFALRDNQCGIPNAKFLGQRYWYNNDPALTLLFDAGGIIAGIQTSIPKSSFTPSSAQANVNYIDDGNYWTLTAYFVDPSTICGTGRTIGQLVSQGTGTGLWLQYGPNPIRDSVRIPTSEEDVKKTSWKFGKCFWTMGKHYWYNVTKDMDCGRFVPNCLLYNNGKLTTFCFASNAFLPSPRYEHPTNEDTKKFLDPVPDCFFTDPTYKKLSTIHVYFIASPRTSSWC